MLVVVLTMLYRKYLELQFFKTLSLQESASHWAIIMCNIYYCLFCFYYTIPFWVFVLLLFCFASFYSRSCYTNILCQCHPYKNLLLNCQTIWFIIVLMLGYLSHLSLCSGVYACKHKSRQHLILFHSRRLPYENAILTLLNLMEYTLQHTHIHTHTHTHTYIYIYIYIYFHECMCAYEGMWRYIYFSVILFYLIHFKR